MVKPSHTPEHDDLRRQIHRLVDHLAFGEGTVDETTEKILDLMVDVKQAELNARRHQRIIARAEEAIDWMLEDPSNLRLMEELEPDVVRRLRRIFTVTDSRTLR